LERLQWEVEKRTSISAARQAALVSLDESDLSRTPLLYLAGDREFGLPNGVSRRWLRQFLSLGGLLVLDSAEGQLGGAFDQSARALAHALFPAKENTLETLSKDHVVFKTFYLVDRPAGRLALSGGLQGVSLDGRLAIVYSQNDLAGACALDGAGNYAYRCDPGGESQREVAIRMGVNLVMYAMCLDYKTDQVHVPFIMKRRRWRSTR